MRIALAALVLSGCAIIKPDYFHDVPTAQICSQIAFYPAWNVNQSARFRELERRGHSCDPATIAAGQQRAQQQLLDAAAIASQPRPAAPPSVTCTTYQAGRNQSTTTCR